MAPRGETITDDLPTLLLNYLGTCQVSPKLYQVIVTTCALASTNPKSKAQEMKKFAKLYYNLWKGGIWIPGQVIENVDSD
jgi:hypothetical protein